MVEKGKYVDSAPSTPSDFKKVSPKISAKIRPAGSKSPIETSNKYLNLMNSEEQDKDISPTAVSIPAINLKISDDYKFTLQEINTNFPNTENKCDRCYIGILPYSIDDRNKIIEFLYKNEKEYVLSEASKKTLQNSIKDLPPDQNNEMIAQDLKKNKSKLLEFTNLETTI
ncbi:hypothetical protein AVEN_261311-1 [Araneus ventricosus]|uniref:Uncharacterized protein n=1 Tax=Araneus ventricosus TaxID=182803 RepID=A0A4Y2J1C7_ARAVE|nr:hypothetical protein AVEN_261311-1 [Araneus ventricosus]